MNVKNGIKRTLACFLVAVLLLTAAPLASLSDLDLSGVADWFSTTAKAVTEGYLTYEVEYGKATITGCNRSISGELVIPDTLGGYPVTSIDWGAFRGCTSLTSVTIGNNVTSIGLGAFENCTGLTSITILDSVTSIDYDAFSGCTGLTKIKWNVESVSGFKYDDNVFSNAGTAGEGIDVFFGDSVKSIPANMFYSSSSYYDTPNIKSVTLGSSVTSIGWGAFRDCTGLTKINWNAESVSDFKYDNYVFSNSGTAGEGIDVVFGDNVKSIPAYLFYSSSSDYKTPNIKSVTIGNSVASIGYEAFYGCTGLTSVTIGTGVTSIGYSAFFGCTGLTKINWNAEDVSDFNRDNYTFSNAGTASEGIDVVFGDNVKSIPAYLFYSSSSNYKVPNIKSVTIGNSITSICNYAFHGCTGLTSITIGNSVTGIGDWAFYNCTGLTSVTIGNSVTSIGDWAFYNCTGLTSVTIGNNVTSIGGYAFDGCTGLTSVTIPNSVTSIGDSAFYGCTGLKCITIPDSVTSIDGGAFSGCTGLTSITIPDSVTSIGYRAFEDCAGLTSVTIPDSVTSIGDRAFDGCTGLTKINWNAENVSDFDYYDSAFSNAGTADEGIDVVFGDNVKSIPSYLFYGFYNTPNIKSVTIGNSVTSIGEYAFRDCTGLTKINWNAENVSDFVYGNYIFSDAGTEGEGIDVVFGDSVKSIPAYAFYGVSNIKSVTIGNNVTSIGISAFDGTAWYAAQPFGDVYAGKVYYKYKGTMPENTSVEIKNGTKSIVDEAFQNCDGLVAVTIPNSVTNIGKSAFKNCTGLTEVTIPGSVKTIGDSAFAITDYSYRGLEKVVLEKGIETIGDSAFSGCRSLRNIEIPNSVTSIGNRAFRGCRRLTSIHIPGSVKIIGDYAFGDNNYRCDSLETVILDEGIETIGVGAFAYAAITRIVIPDSVTSLGGDAFYYCNSLTTATIGSGIETISSGTFKNCPNLTTIKIKKGVKSIEKDAFNGIKTIPDVFFEGSEEEWKDISIDQSNDMILRANMYYNVNVSHEHSYTETVKEATCTEDGLKTFTCSCGRTYSEKIPATGHNYQPVVVEPTCVSIGYETSTCKNCGESYFVRAIPAMGHKFIGQTVNPTCISPGYETETCEICDECRFVRAIPATGHDWEAIKSKEPTCTEPGVSKGIHCTECGYTEKSEVIPALGHDIVVDVEAKDPTCTESGTTKGVYCTRCDYKVEAEEIEPLGHTDSNNDGKCDTCGESLGTTPQEPENPSSNCSCACHKKGIAKFFFKIGLFFQKIFKKNRICKCGVWHY